MGASTVFSRVSPKALSYLVEIVIDHNTELLDQLERTIEQKRNLHEPGQHQDESAVDIISIWEPDSNAVLTISDHLDSSDSVQHQTILQTRLNRYLAFVESGELRSYASGCAEKSVW
jgi:uncharacterized protein DUF6572